MGWFNEWLDGPDLDRGDVLLFLIAFWLFSFMAGVVTMAALGCTVTR